MMTSDDDRIQFICHITVSRDVAPCGIDPVLLPCVCACADEVRFPKRREYVQEVQIWRPCVRRGGTQTPDRAKVSLFASCSPESAPFSIPKWPRFICVVGSAGYYGGQPEGEQRLGRWREQMV
jgi:hypothetical protein